MTTDVLSSVTAEVYCSAHGSVAASCGGVPMKRTSTWAAPVPFTAYQLGWSSAVSENEPSPFTGPLLLEPPHAVRPNPRHKAAIAPAIARIRSTLTTRAAARAVTSLVVMLFDHVERGRVHDEAA